MEDNYEIKERPSTVRGFIKSWKFWRPFLGIALGSLAGFSYYYFVGCTSGSCAITSLIKKKEVEAKAQVAQCCAKISKTVAGCHD